ncbi:hypothetical protein BC941DRAFT_196748 [Chlamydoabsidia padenii]|nr:hypothetical protein BC941DRAFT_196748 [Chlamydoabsidia padenii]
MDLQQLIPVILDLLCKNENEGYDIREEQEQLRTQFALQVDSLQYRIRIDNAYTVATACYPCSFYATYTTTNNTGYWDIVHPGLDDTRLDSSYHANYRVNRDTFNLLVATLSQHPVYQSRNPAYPQTPCYIQVATILWRMTNTHAGYRIVKNTMGISNGSYMNFTTRFLKAMVDCFKHKIHWPTTESEVRRTIASFTARPDSEGVIRGRLPCGVIGALDGKLVNIFKPYNVHSEYYRDRKGNLSMNLTAICDGDLRFTYVYTGNPGNNYSRNKA